MSSFSYFTSQTNLNSYQNIKSQYPSDPNFVIMIALVVIVYLTCRRPQYIFFIRPCDVAFLLKHKHLPA